MYAIFFGAILFLSLVSVLVVKLKLVSKKLSYPGLFFLVFLSLVLTIYSKPTLGQLGLVLPSITSVFLYSLVTAISCFLFYLLNKYLYKQKPVNNIFKNSSSKMTFYIVLSASAQEFLFRSFLYYSLSTIGLLNLLSMALLSSLLFGIAHLGFEDKYLAQGTFVMGIIWGLSYFIVPDLLLISISHAVIGLFAFSQGLIKRQIFFGQKLQHQ